MLAYAASLVPEAADEITAIDDAMRLGYNWKLGPFELIDKIGGAWLAERLASDGIAIPPILARRPATSPFYRVEAGKRQFLGLDGNYRDLVRPEGVILLEDIKLVSQPVLKASSAALWDIGDGVACFEFTGKGNAIDQAAMTLLHTSIKTVAEQLQGAGDLQRGLALFVGRQPRARTVRRQYRRMERDRDTDRHGAGHLQGAEIFEISLSSRRRPAWRSAAAARSCCTATPCRRMPKPTPGLVECGVGLIPGWGGCKEMLTRWKANPKMPKGPMPTPIKIFEMVSTATVSKSAAQAQDMMILRPGDGITMNRNRLLADAKAKALALAEAYVPPPKLEPINLPGAAGKLGMTMAAASFHKRGLATESRSSPYPGRFGGYSLGGVPSIPVDPVTEEDILKLERHRLHALDQDPGNAGADRAHARNRQAAAELSDANCGPTTLKQTGARLLSPSNSGLPEFELTGDQVGQARLDCGERLEAGVAGVLRELGSRVKDPHPLSPPRKGEGERTAS